MYAYFEGQLFFYYFKLQNYFSFSITIDRYVSCILVDSAVYACAYTQDNVIKIVILVFYYKRNNQEEEKEINDNLFKNIMC